MTEGQPPSYEETMKGQQVYLCVPYQSFQSRTNVFSSQRQEFCSNHVLPVHLIALPDFLYSNTHLQQQEQDDESFSTVVTTPTNYVVSSALACLCCFTPTGLYALIIAVQAKNAAKKGDMDKAYRLNSRSRFCIVTSILIGFIWITTCLIIMVSRHVT